MSNNTASIKYPLAILGLAMIIGAAFSFIDTINILYSGSETQGTVVGYKESLSNNSDARGPIKMYAPQVNFKALDGKSIRFTSLTSSNTPDYKIGQKIRVLYFPENPQDALIKEFESLWLWGSILCLFGVIFFYTGISEIIKARAHKNY